SSEIFTWEVATGKRLSGRPAPPHRADSGKIGKTLRETLESVACTPGGEVVLKIFRKWQVQQDNPGAMTTKHAGSVLKIYEAASGKLRTRVEGFPIYRTTLLLSPDGKRFAVAGSWQDDKGN